MRSTATIALLVLALTGCGGNDSAAVEPDPVTTAPAEQPSKEDVFDFDRDGDLEVTEGETAQQPKFTATAMSYASPGGDRVSGIVLATNAEERPAGVIFMHGAGGSRIDFLGDASELA